MASLSTDAKGNRVIQFVAADGKRRTLRLGKLPKKTAESVKLRVEDLNAAAIANVPPDRDTSMWLAGVGDDLHAKLASLGLTQLRASAVLDDFISGYIAMRTDVKPRTKLNLGACRTRLVEFFGKTKPLGAITPGDADRWLLWLKERYANGTIGRTVKRAKQLFRSAVRGGLIHRNPFDDVKPHSQVNESRKHFVSLDVTQKVIQACPDGEWRLIVALCRFARHSVPFGTSAVAMGGCELETRSDSHSIPEDGALRRRRRTSRSHLSRVASFPRRSIRPGHAGFDISHQPLSRRQLEPPHATSANHPSSRRALMAEAVPEPAGQPRNGTGRPISAARGVRLDRQLRACRSKALPSSDRLGL